MTQHFSIDGQDVRNPSNGPGRLFARLAEALSAQAGRPSGIGVAPGDPEYRATSHPSTARCSKGSW